MMLEDKVEVRQRWTRWHSYTALCSLVVGCIALSWWWLELGASAPPPSPRSSSSSLSAGAASTVPTSIAPSTPSLRVNRPNTKAPIEAPSLSDALMKTPVGRHLRGFSLGKPVSFRNIKVYPIRLAQALPRRRTPMSIDESFKKRKVRVTEQGSGTVPFISLKKRRSDPIFVMTGEMFLGAKQDRISKHDLLLPRRPGRFRLPVYCVEQGRWNYNSSSFRSGKSVGTYRLRRAVTKKLSQGSVWGEVSRKTAQLNARTQTDTMAASYRSRLFREQSPAYLKHLRPFAKKRAQSQGFVSLIKGHISSVEIFANPKLFQKMWPKLAKAMVLDAIDKQFKPSPFKEHQFNKLLERLAMARFRRTRTPGIGREMLISDSQVSGTLLEHNRRMVHLTLFPDDSRSSGRRTRQRFQRLKQLRGRGLRLNNRGLGNLGGRDIQSSRQLQGKYLLELFNKKGRRGSWGFGKSTPQYRGTRLNKPRKRYYKRHRRFRLNRRNRRYRRYYKQRRSRWRRKSRRYNKRYRRKKAWQYNKK